MIEILEKLVGEDVTIYAGEFSFSGKLTKVNGNEYLATVKELLTYSSTKTKTVIRIGAIDAVTTKK